MQYSEQLCILRECSVHSMKWEDESTLKRTWQKQFEVVCDILLEELRMTMKSPSEDFVWSVGQDFNEHCSRKCY